MISAKTIGPSVALDQIERAANNPDAAPLSHQFLTRWRARTANAQAANPTAGTSIVTRDIASPRTNWRLLIKTKPAIAAITKSMFCSRRQQRMHQIAARMYMSESMNVPIRMALVGWLANAAGM